MSKIFRTNKEREGHFIEEEGTEYEKKRKQNQTKPTSINRLSEI